MPTATKQRTDPRSLGLIPADDEEKKRKKKPQPDFSPDALGLIPLERTKPANDDFSPEALGLVPAHQPEEAPAPAEAEPEPDNTWDWASHKAWQFVETVGEGLFGKAPPPANADMSRIEEQPPPPDPNDSDVPKDKIFAPGGVPDAIVPDFVERPVRGIYDWFTSDRTQHNLDVGGAQMVSGVDHLIANSAMLTRYAKDFVLEQTGLPHNAQSDEEWKAFEDAMRAKSESYARKSAYARSKEPEGGRSVADALIEAAPQLPAMVAEYGAATALFGPVAGFAAIEALNESDKGADAAAIAGLKGAAMGAFFEWTNILSRPLRIPALAAAGGGMAAAEGGSDADIAAQAILFPALGLPQRSGPVGMRYLREHGVTPDMRDLGAHARDLLLGGNVGRSQRDMEGAGEALGTVRKRHADELQQEQARYIVAESEAKVMKPGETQADVNERLSALRGEHEQKVEDLTRRHEKEEQPLRHLFEMAERRHQRALHPFRMPWQAAPYMRALHSAERGVVVAHTAGYEQLTQAKKDADDRLKELMGEAQGLRQRDGTPEERERYQRMADDMEMEGGRLHYDMMRGVQDEIEARITKVEMEAERRRDELVEALSAGNKIEGRRAAWLANYRSMQDAYRAGIRLVRRGEERARTLLDQGDKHVNITKRRLAGRGVSEENIATRDEYIAQMRKAEEVRDSYRELASLEMLDAQYRADSRVSRAQRKFDVAVEAAREAGIPRDKLPSRRAAKNEEELTKPEDAKKNEDGWDLPDEDGSVRGVDYETAYRKALEGGKEDPRLGALAQELDPLVAHIQDPADILPAIARIAKQLGHEPASTRGKQTAAKREILAERLGMTEEEFLKSPYGKAFSDYEIEAAIMLMDRAWSRLQTAYRAWKNNPGSKIAGDRARLELVRFLMIRNRLRGAAAEAGRSLRMFRELKKRYGSITEPMTDAQFDKVMTFDKPGKAGKLAETFARGDWFRGLMDWYIQGLLSSFQTDFVNIYSGMGMAGWKPLESAVAAAIGITRWTVWNFALRPILQPFIAAYRGLAKTGMLGAKEAERAFARSERFTRPSEFINFDRVRFGEFGARMRGYMEAFVPAVIQFFKSWLTGERYLGETNFGYRTSAIFDNPLAPGRRLSAIDDFFKVLLNRAGIRAHAYRQAIAESQNMPMGGPKDFVAYRTRVRQRYRELVKNPNGRILESARQEALEGTFQKEPTILTGTGKAIEQSRFLKILIPFRKVLLNTVEFLIAGTPAFPLLKKTRLDIIGANGRIAQDTAFAHLLMVTGGATAVFFWAMSGNVREGSDQPASRAMNSISGVPPLAVRIPGTEEWITLNRVDPVGGIVALGAAAARAWKQGEAVGDEDAQQKAFGVLTTAMFGMVTQRAGLQGLMDFLDAFQGGSYGNDTNSAAAWMNNVIATMTVPQAVSVDARTSDPYLRYSKTLMEKIMNRTRYRSELWPVRNMWGDPVKAYANYEQGRRVQGYDGRMYDLDYLLNITQPFYWGKLSKDPATQAMLKLYELYRWAPGSVKREIGGRKLTDQEYDFYAKRSGNLQYEAMRGIVDSPEWQETERLEDELKAMRKNRPSDFGSTHDVEVRKRTRAYDMAEKKLAEELRVKRYKLFLKTRSAFAAARKKARLETAGTSDGKTRGAFPDIWTRQKRKDLSRNPGEINDWMDGTWAWLNSESDQEDWDADEQTAHEAPDQFDPRDPYGDLKRWREQDRRPTNPPRP